ncbi:choice-of-anchor A family protein [Hyalangium rubrum]|uniref:Choice-of-anchor A family protein n=1 Tax=Hyalangium rubrum TaxID=3103134 RepID=A0ABU5HHY0_9BACT|nr:choice-of-anchor A family protein [Hyalangium sp. s54d21]MDY7233060.1 choice-of-anchor A family protein [Hyalangium sp. s54d21]
MTEPLTQPALEAASTVRQEVNSLKKVLILGSSVSGGTSSREAAAASALGIPVEVVTPAQWSTMTAEQFMSYRALIIGDGTCEPGERAFQAAIDTRDRWGAIVDGNVVIIGTNPTTNGTEQLVENAISFATAIPKLTGMYVALGCAYQGAAPNTPVPLLQPFGNFTVAGADCGAHTAGHVFSQYPALVTEGLSDGALSGRECAARSVFTSYPERNFSIAAVAVDANGSLPGSQLHFDYDWQESFAGTPYILTYGTASLGLGCGGDSNHVSSGEECDLGDNGNGQPALQLVPEPTCSWSCRESWCGDGILDPAIGEECDDGVRNGRETDASANIGACTAFCKIPDFAPQDGPPVALCRDVTVVAEYTCGVEAFIDNGSMDADGDLVGCTQSPAGPYAIGTTSVTLTCTDAASRSATCTSLVTVVDRVVPTVTLVGPVSQTLECGSAYTDPGATAGDLCVGDLTAAIVRTGSVNAHTPGIYSVSYDVEDSAGNSPEEVTRTVTVSDTLPPVLTLNGPASQTLECGTPYANPGATASDLCAGDLSASIVTSGAVNVALPGNYTLSYAVVDPAGQGTTLGRTVKVQDTLAPQLQVRPGPSVLECNGAPYVDPGATASDVCAGNLTPNIVVTSNLNQTQAGQYSVTYRVTDNAGNVSTAVRSLTVGSCATCINVNLSDYNLFLLGDYNGGHDVEGKVAVGGNLTMTDFSMAHSVPDGSTARSVVAGGNLTLSRGGVWGEAWYGGSFSADTTVVYPRGRSVSQGTPIDFAARFAELRGLSTKLAGLTVNGTTRRETWGGVMLRGTNAQVNVFKVNASAFTGAKLLSIEAPAGSLVVVNIYGASATFTGFGHSFSGGINQNGILYNFVDTTSITAQGYGFWGTVLAPYAHVNFSDGSFDGGLYALSLTGNAEGHINVLTNRQICR